MIFMKAIFFVFTCFCCVSAKFVVQSEDKYIGSFVSNQNQKTLISEYFLLGKTGNWFRAQSLCEEQGASLVSIETIDEMKALSEILDKHGINTYWTSGRYSGAHKNWVWTPNDLIYPIPPNLTWSNGHPKTPNSLYRIAIRYEFMGSTFETILETLTEKIICEVASEDVAIPCYESNDLSVVVDSSASISSSEYELTKSFVAKLSNAFTMYPTSRFQLVIFASGVVNRIPLTNTMTPPEIELTVLTSRHYRGTTSTHLGIEAAITELTNNERGVPKTIVVLTDGHSNNFNLTVQYAEDAVARGIRTFSVGIGQNTNSNELLAIAGYNQDNVYTLETFDDLIRILVPISIKVCPTI